MNKELRKKIIDLFEYRQLPELIKFGGKAWDQQYYERLIALQYHIYKLDHELETNWEVDLSIIKDRWIRIYEALEALNVPKSMHDRYCRHIYKYQKHELDIRLLKLPTRLSMEYFYFYKSCDVKLLRRIIYRNNPDLSKAIKESQWRLFDLVTEINDDVEDLQEDLSTINGNRFLITLKQFGEAKTKSIFREFLEEIESRNDKETNTCDHINLSSWTEVQIIETLNLMDRQIELFKDLDSSLYNRLLQKEMEAL